MNASAYTPTENSRVYYSFTFWILSLVISIEQSVTWSDCTRWATCLVKPHHSTLHVPSVSRLVTNLHTKYITWRNQNGHPQNSELATYCSGSFTQKHPRGSKRHHSRGAVRVEKQQNTAEDVQPFLNRKSTVTVWISQETTIIPYTTSKSWSL